MGSQSESEYPVAVLTHDALLHVFSYLSILEKSVAARVCKRWNVLARQGELWKYVNLRDDDNLRSSKAKLTSIYVVSYKETDIRNLITVYFGKCLKELRLHTPVSNNLLRLFALKCPNLKLIDMEGDPLKVDFSLLSCKLVSIYLRLPLRSVKRSEIGRFAIFSLYRLTNLYLQHGRITDNVLCRLMQSHSLRNLALDGCHWQLAPHKIPYFSLCLPELTCLKLTLCQFSSVRFLNSLIRHISTYCVHLERLQVIQPTTFDDLPADCGSLLIDISGLKHLQQLVMGGMKGLTLEAVVHLSHSLPNIYDIAFLHCHVTDDILKQIGEGFLNILSLDVSGSKCISNIGLRYLRKHPNLQILKLELCLNLTLDAIVETILTLPRIETVQLPDSILYKSCQETLQSQIPKLQFVD